MNCAMMMGGLCIFPISLFSKFHIYHNFQSFLKFLKRTTPLSFRNVCYLNTQLKNSAVILASFVFCLNISAHVSSLSPPSVPGHPGRHVIILLSDHPPPPRASSLAVSRSAPSTLQWQPE